MGLHVNFKLSLFLKGHATFRALKLLCISVLFLMNIPPVHVCELPVADLAMVIAFPTRIVHHSKMNQKAASELENFGTNVAHKSVVIVHSLDVVQKVLIHLEAALTISAFVFVHNFF